MLFLSLHTLSLVLLQQYTYENDFNSQVDVSDAWQI